MAMEWNLQINDSMESFQLNTSIMEATSHSSNPFLTNTSAFHAFHFQFTFCKIILGKRISQKLECNLFIAYNC
ncbi:MAG: hypothetical protein CMI18_10425 [Opitutaceae bacterium]|nr:hypothetical protein [Opitutaceae bacterium]